MRLWSIHPKYLDAKGLVALWREGLLAQNVLLGKTKGYQYHPQLIRFKKTTNPLGAIATYLIAIADEANLRRYAFDSSKINNNRFSKKISVTQGQIQYEFTHLMRKLSIRDQIRYHTFSNIDQIEIHSSFIITNGDIEKWEIVKPNSSFPQ